jgi:hypothetical protein
MKVRRGKTPLQPVGDSLRTATTDKGQMHSTIWDAESTKLSTKFTLRSHCRTSGGGSLGHEVEVPLAPSAGQAVRLGFFRNSGGTGHSVALGREYLELFCTQWDALSEWGKPRPDDSPDSPFSQMTSMADVEAEEIEL